jgi:YidC/Oxa1 family membrane protein insertase
MVVQMKVQMMPQTNPQMKIFTYVFPVMIFAIFNRLASGLSLYYLIFNVVTAVQQKWINMRIESGKTDPGEGETSPSAPAKKGRPTPRGKTPRKGKKVRS